MVYRNRSYTEAFVKQSTTDVGKKVRMEEEIVRDFFKLGNFKMNGRQFLEFNSWPELL